LTSRPGAIGVSQALKQEVANAPARSSRGGHVRQFFSSKGLGSLLQALQDRNVGLRGIAASGQQAGVFYPFVFEPNVEARPQLNPTRVASHDSC